MKSTNSSYCRPDASFRNPETGEIFHLNVGRRNKRPGTETGNVDPIIREREALEDLRAQGHNVQFEHYDP